MLQMMMMMNWGRMQTQTLTLIEPILIVRRQLLFSSSGSLELKTLLFRLLSRVGSTKITLELNKKVLQNFEKSSNVENIWAEMSFKILLLLFFNF